jgi:hypothetical protein
MDLKVFLRTKAPLLLRRLDAAAFASGTNGSQGFMQDKDAAAFVEARWGDFCQCYQWTSRFCTRLRWGAFEEIERSAMASNMLC